MTKEKKNWEDLSRNVDTSARRVIDEFDTGMAGMSRGLSVARLEKGTVLLERYEIKRLLGVGGMGQVFLCQDMELDEEYALKAIRL